MKKIIIALILMFNLGETAWNIKCGLPPLPPLGCSIGDAECVCTEGECYWIWHC